MDGCFMRAMLIVVTAALVLGLSLAAQPIGQPVRQPAGQPAGIEPGAPAVIRPGEPWPDADGEHINAHGGGLLRHDGVWYWYGEHRSAGRAGTRSEVGVRVYRSTDLVTWHDAGVALAVSDEPGHDIERGCIIERPKVLFNSTTGRFVMWFHLELKGQGYKAARAGVAVAEGPLGPFEFIRSERPLARQIPLHAGDLGRLLAAATDLPPGVDPEPAIGQALKQIPQDRIDPKDRHFVRDFPGGQMARDQTVFLDADGTAYHIYASEENATLHIAELSEDFTEHTGRFVRVFAGRWREAPALFLRGETYHLITSGCTGWAPNPGMHATAPSIWGPWTEHGNPFVDDPDTSGAPTAERSFEAQSTFVLGLDANGDGDGFDIEDRFILLADRWHPPSLRDSPYVWLTIGFAHDLATIRWQEAWSLEDGTAWELPASVRDRRIESAPPVPPHPPAPPARH